MTQLKNTFNQEESEQVYAGEDKNNIKANAEETTNFTSAISPNITKVNCSLEKIYGPVEVLQEIIFYYCVCTETKILAQLIITLKIKKVFYIE